MKRKHLLLICTFAISLFALSSCGGDDPTPPPPPPGGPTSVVLSSDNATIFDNSDNVFTLKIVGNNSVDYTSESTFYVNGNAITGNIFDPEGNSGSYTVYAKYGDIESNTIILNVIGENFAFESISISSNIDVAFIESEFSFKVLGTIPSAGNIDITNLMTIFVNDSPIDGTTFTPLEANNYSVYAKLGTQTSNTITITAIKGYKHKVLIEDFTGAWCPYCTRILYAIDLLHAQTSDVLIAAIHRGNPSGGYYDPFNVPEAAALEDKLGVEGYPTAWIGRTAVWTYPEPNNINQPINMIQGKTAYGISISSSLSASSGTVDISVAFDAALSSAKLVVYVLEDNLILDQANGYSDLYGGQHPIPNFNHKDVVRKVVTNILGDAIPAEKTTAGSTYTTTLNANYTSANVANLKVMAFVLDASGNVVNVQVAKANTTLGFEE